MTTNLGWNKNGEFNCICGSTFGKNLKGQSPFLLVSEHLKTCPTARRLRQNVRNFLLTATPKELQKEHEISSPTGPRPDWFRAHYIFELIQEESKNIQGN